ncbi:hypothetical protein APS_2514 [Acetobacter pasteurianus subsp. pasteurianus LMG 1262 = NBRC 106471]|nr:hypothetical protein APS_2514 [Acetobacter pasteurianus subsp. pasteurianus LMG 1262 = NBRC 106471]
MMICFIWLSDKFELPQVLWRAKTVNCDKPMKSRAKKLRF